MDIATLFAVGALGKVAYRDGSDWHVTDESSGALYAIFGLGPKRVFAAGAGGKIGVYDGTQWEWTRPGSGAALRGVWANGLNDAIVVGSNRRVWRHNGSTWSRMTVPTGIGELYAIHGVQGQIAFAVGSKGTILRLDMQAQDAPAVSGYVRENGQPVANVEVQLKLGSQGVKYTRTDASGYYQFTGINPDDGWKVIVKGRK